MVGPKPVRSMSSLKKKRDWDKDTHKRKNT